MKCDSGNPWQNGWNGHRCDQLARKEHGENEFWRDEGARLKSERNLSLTVGLKVLYNEYHQHKEELCIYWQEIFW